MTKVFERPKGALLLDQLTKEISKLKRDVPKILYVVHDFSHSTNVYKIYKHTIVNELGKILPLTPDDGMPEHIYAQDFNIIPNNYNDHYVFFFKKRAKAYLKTILDRRRVVREADYIVSDRWQRVAI